MSSEPEIYHFVMKLYVLKEELWGKIICIITYKVETFLNQRIVLNIFI